MQGRLIFRRQRSQNPLPARACGFKSLLRYFSFEHDLPLLGTNWTVGGVLIADDRIGDPHRLRWQATVQPLGSRF